uniref:Replication-associated protein n=1 Tax=Emberiza rustica CRESS-DNA-virus sp. TaxID=2815032 RepID=A0A8A4XCG1_9VIRU|nr:MAG: replication-associated protein [Emberiza rustica CRESS-DNA-virus sp.]
MPRGTARSGTGFRIQGKQIFLTYSQTTTDVNLLWEFLNTLRPRPKRAIICRELHADGNEHLHAAVEFERRFDSQRVSVFDFAGHHPSAETVRTWAAAVNYCRKEGALETAYFGCTAEDAAMGDPGETAPSGAAAYAYAESCTEIRDWYIYCIDNNITYAYANAIWNSVHGARPPTYFERPNGGTIGDGLQQLRWDDDFHTVFVCGPSGYGKTCWALREAPLPFLLVTDIDDLGFYSPAVHKCIVFDEIRCTGDAAQHGRWPLTSQIKLVTWDTPVSIRIRYKIAHLPAHVPKIFTSCDTFPMVGDQQIKRRVHAINLYDDGEHSFRWVD